MFNSRFKIKNKIFFYNFKIFGTQNLLCVNAASILRYCLLLLDVLFTQVEIKEGAVEPTGAGKFAALDEARIKILKGKLLLLFNFLNNL
jgi:hypothetical protein